MIPLAVDTGSFNSLRHELECVKVDLVLSGFETKFYVIDSKFLNY